MSAPAPNVQGSAWALGTTVFTSVPSRGEEMVTHVTRMVREAHARRVPVRDRREHRAQVQHHAVGVAVIGPDGRGHQVGRVPADAAHLGGALEAVAVHALDQQAHLRAHGRRRAGTARRTGA